MRSCSACGVDFYYRPDVRLLYSALCDHRVCESCLKRLFHQGRAYPCPGCGQSLRAEDFSEKQREAREVQSEAKVRRQICDIYCKAEQDFPSLEDYNDYLEEREDLIYRLVNPASHADVEDVWREIAKYQELNAEQIMREQSAQPRKKVQKIKEIIEVEGHVHANANAEWDSRRNTEGVPEGNQQHPFMVAYRDLLLAAARDEPPAHSGNLAAPASPRPAPQPMLDAQPPSPDDRAARLRQNPERHARGGGMVPGAVARKACYYFFADLTAAAAVAAAAEAASGIVASA